MSVNSVTYQSQAWIDGQWVNTTRRFRVVNPASGDTLAEVTDCGAEEAKQALEASTRAFVAWSKTTVYERSKILRRFHDLLLDNVESLAHLMSEEMGKPIRESRGEVRYAAGFVEWYAEEAKRLYGETIPSAFEDKRILVQAVPVGPVLGITPWNFPLAMVTRKLAPALAAGCTFILKPAEQSPLTALAAAELSAEAGFPAGVFQVLPTNHPAEVANPLLEDERIRKMTFTGSTEVGKMLYAKAAGTVKRVSLELGGHAPLLIFADADMEQAAKEAIACKFRNSGQTCVCTNRIYVQESARETFIDAFVAEVRKLRVGAPLANDTDIGPLVDEQGLEKVKAHVQDAVEKGSRVVLGGKVLNGTSQGFFFEPTVLVDVKPGMRIMTEETFGPVAPVVTFSDEDEAIRLANDTPFGLAAYAFTRDVGRVFRLGESLEYGIIGINDGVPSAPQVPFGGVKASGVGREGGHYGLEEYIERKFISIKL